jgi:lysophospholipase L1-like esterase
MRVAFLGDSLTEGHPGESFLRRLARLLPDDELLNRGRAGDTVPSLLARLRADGVPPADAAVLWIGTNDAFLGDWYLPPLDDVEPWGTGAPADGAGAYDARRLRPAYDAVLDLALGASPLVACLPPVLPDPFAGEVAERVAGIKAMVAAAAAARLPRTPVFDLAPAFAAAAGDGRGGGFTIDGVHLNARGADVVAAAVRALLELLRETASSR